MNGRKILLILVLSLVLMVPVLGSLPASAQTGTKPEIIVFVEEQDPWDAIDRLEAGELDIYARDISIIELLDRIEASPELDYYRSYGSYNELTFNPAVFNNGKLNPFAEPRVREAMNLLIDREYITQEIMGGYATPRWTAINTVSSDATAFFPEIRAIELAYTYNQPLAEEQISVEMLALGASLQGGVWTYAGEPVEISVLIREDDQRYHIGNYVADQLEAIGFTVIRDYKSLYDSSPIWYTGDPENGEWHIYTGGWIEATVSRDLGTNFAYFYTDMGAQTPLWEAYVNDPEFYSLAKRLNVQDFGSLEERHDMIARALTLAMEDSARVWLCDHNSFTPRRADISLAADLNGGVVGAMLWAKTIQAGDSSVKIAVPDVLAGPWNPIAGTTLAYEMMAIRGTVDFGVVPDPYTGIPLPDRIKRAEVVVQEGLPVNQNLDWAELSFEDEIIVPGDAWGDWDAKEQQFITVEDLHPDEKVTARVKSTVYYPDNLYTAVKWHDGSEFSIVDVLMKMILTFDRGKEDSDIYDESAKPALDSFMSQFKGVKIIHIDPLTIETYSDGWYSDAELNVTTWWPYYAQGIGAWHTINLGIRAEAAGEAAFSASKETDEVPWLDFSKGDSVDILNTQLGAWRSDEVIPYGPTLGDYLQEGELNSRICNLEDWFSAYDHFWIGTGPYYLFKVGDDWDTLELRRFDEHPDFIDDPWTGFAGRPIPAVQIDGPESIALGADAVYDISVTQGPQVGAGQLSLAGISLRSGEPYPSRDIARVDYLLISQNKVFFSGQANLIEEGRFQVAVDADTISMLPSGELQLEVAVVSKRIAMLSTGSVGIDNKKFIIFLPLTLR